MMASPSQPGARTLKALPLAPPLPLRSHALAAAAQAAGKFKDEIVPVQTVLKDPKTGEGLCHSLVRSAGLPATQQNVQAIMSWKSCISSRWL